MKLGLNIDHIATLRNARGGSEPNLVEAAKLALKQNVFALTMHLREDRRHIKDEDLYEVKKLNAKINLEMAAVKEIQEIALDLVPYSVCLVPEKRLEITTEGGLNVAGQKEYLKDFIKPLKQKGIIVSMFIDADEEQIKACKYIDADYIEIHTGSFANAFEKGEYKAELEKIKQGAKLAQSLGLKVNAGHGLNYQNVHLMHEVEGLCELNIGHSIISRSVFFGLEEAITKMADLIK